MRILVGLVIVLLAAAVALGVALILQPPSGAERRAAVLSVAEAFSVALAEYDYRDLDAQVEQVVALSTGAFRDEYEQTFGSAELREEIVVAESVATAEIETGPLLAELDGTQARTLTVLTQTTASADLEEPTARRMRIELLLVETEAGWRVNVVQLT